MDQLNLWGVSFKYDSVKKSDPRIHLKLANARSHHLWIESDLRILFQTSDPLSQFDRAVFCGAGRSHCSPEPSLREIHDH